MYLVGSPLGGVVGSCWIGRRMASSCRMAPLVVESAAGWRSLRYYRLIVVGLRFVFIGQDGRHAVHIGRISERGYVRGVHGMSGYWRRVASLATVLIVRYVMGVHGLSGHPRRLASSATVLSYTRAEWALAPLDFIDYRTYLMRNDERDQVYSQLLIIPPPSPARS